MVMLLPPQENGALPRGPDEVGPVYRARARLGYAGPSFDLWKGPLVTCAC